VFIGAPPDAQDGADGVAAAFGLTPAETRVLASLFAGSTEDRGRQAELMRLWTGLISPTGSNL
jgi:hypothetical protein